MKKILITGGAGYIGSHAVKVFLEKGYSVVVFDSLIRGYREPMEILAAYGDLTFIQGDLTRKEAIEAVFREHEIDTVLHFAALCLVNESMEQPGLYFRNNVDGAANLFDAMRDAGVRNIIFSSTAATYGATAVVPIDERQPQDPENVYGESKLLVERMLKWYGQLADFHSVIFHYFNVCGADSAGMIGDSKKPSQLLMQNAVRGAMGIQPFSYTCASVDTSDGTPIRDYIDVEDLVAAHFLAYEYLAQGGASDTFNLGNGRGSSVKEIVSAVEAAFGTTMEKRQGEARKGESARLYSDPTHAREVLGWRPRKSLTDSIESLRKWYTGHPDGYSR